MRFFIVTVSLVSSLAPLGAAPVAAAGQPSLRSCEITGVLRVTRCATIPVAEDRSKPQGKRIDLHVVIVQAPAPAAPDPILFFAGGPGQGAATLAAGIMRDLEAVAANRDVVLIDQRGTGRSNPLTCDDGFLLAEAGRVADLKQCHARLARSADLDQYGTEVSADDAAEVVRSLGIARVNIVAASYGTRLAFSFMARHPDLVRTAVLRAVAPPGFNIVQDGSAHARAALQRVFDDCRAEQACGDAFPSLREDFARLRQRLRSTPATISLDTLDRTLYAMLLATPSRQMIPWLVHTAADGDLGTLTRIAGSLEAVYRSVAVGEYLSVVCSEDVPRAAVATPHEGFDVAAGAMAACRHWPVKPARALGGESRFETPTLVLSGELDPAMPAAAGAEAMRHLARGTHVALPATAHGPTFPGCATEIAREFISTGGTAPKDRSCLEALVSPPFKIN
jgi:pimeloyl-ACP methyl ester carboxylesterase